MNFRYEWYVLTKDGKLVKPDWVGPYYHQLLFVSYTSEENAYKDWQEIESRHPYQSEDEMVLLKIFSRPST